MLHHLLSTINNSKKLDGNIFFLFHWFFSSATKLKSLPVIIPQSHLKTPTCRSRWINQTIKAILANLVSKDGIQNISFISIEIHLYLTFINSLPGIGKTSYKAPEQCMRIISISATCDAVEVLYQCKVESVRWEPFIRLRIIYQLVWSSFFLKTSP